MCWTKSYIEPLTSSTTQDIVESPATEVRSAQSQELRPRGRECCYKMQHVSGRIPTTDSGSSLIRGGTVSE
ncbi:hypothetical protein PAXRUDRAFT_828541 [Paxillus rubicundulus Ve08.2h10]|uniref:Uncharacterized protein n=1 Tax=Paxillus rubicundulus Ve08.2h10 TaxID=930991 RepID=A0A0D0D9W5_9AGAM|nr:hypothetical protein PAXRUDRAFT_828541 [Paxillus rubicundulus Ve08.2h10]